MMGGPVRCVSSQLLFAILYSGVVCFNPRHGSLQRVRVNLPFRKLPVEYARPSSAFGKDLIGCVPHTTRSAHR
jgi:hypothetical protein